MISNVHSDDSYLTAPKHKADQGYIFFGSMSQCDTPILLYRVILMLYTILLCIATYAVDVEAKPDVLFL